MRGALSFRFIVRSAAVARRDHFPDFEAGDHGEQGETGAIGGDDDAIALQRAVYDPSARPAESTSSM